MWHHCPTGLILSQDEDMSDVDQLSDAKYHDNEETMCHLQGEVQGENNTEKHS